MKTGLLIILATVAASFDINLTFACVRKLNYLFWSPIIDRVSGDCSFAGFQPNPSGILFTSVIAAISIGFVVWRTRR